MPIDSAATFVRLVERLGLLLPEQLPELARLASSGDPRALAKELLRRDWLTAYQINKIFNDNGPALVLGNRYVLTDRLGSGGMGQVFKARDRKLGRAVAVKIIHPERLDNPVVVKRFQREIRGAARLDHPNVVHAYDADEEVGNHFLVMEYVEGIDLGRLVRAKGALPPALACEYVRQAALGLQHAHEQGLVHRDIKPANLLLTTRTVSGRPAPEPLVKILDLGLALLQQPTIDHSNAGLTAAGIVVGTVDFLAPEQARDASGVDVRADLYSLGCTLYFLLTGKVPFSGATPTNKIFKHALEEAEPVEKLRPEVSPDLAAVVRRLMAKRPEDRYQTPAELAAVLGELLKGRVSRPAPATAPPRPVDTPRLTPPPVATTADLARPSPATTRKPVVRGTAIRKAAKTASTSAVPAAPKQRPPDWWQWVLLNAVGLLVLLILIGVVIFFARRLLAAAG